MLNSSSCSVSQTVDYFRVSLLFKEYISLRQKTMIAMIKNVNFGAVTCMKTDSYSQRDLREMTDGEAPTSTE